MAERGQTLRRETLNLDRMSVFPPGALPRQLANSPAIQHMFKLPRPKPIRSSSTMFPSSNSAQMLGGTNSFQQAEAVNQLTSSSVSAAVPLSPKMPNAPDPWVFKDMRSETVAVERESEAEERACADGRDSSPRLMEGNVSRPRTPSTPGFEISSPRHSSPDTQLESRTEAERGRSAGPTQRTPRRRRQSSVYPPDFRAPSAGPPVMQQPPPKTPRKRGRSVAPPPSQIETRSKSRARSAGPARDRAEERIQHAPPEPSLPEIRSKKRMASVPPGTGPRRERARTLTAPDLENLCGNGRDEGRA